MNNLEQILEKFGKKVQTVHMTPEEKNLRRNEVMKFMEKAAATPGLHADKKLISRKGNGWFFRKMRHAYIAIPLAIAISTGVVFASQNSLPGDPLYGIKVNVIEKAQTALAVNDEQKAQLHATFAVRRLEEAETLAKQNKLNAKVSREISNNFKERSQDLTQELDSLKAEHQQDKAARINSNFDQSLQRHKAIFDRIKNSSGDSGDQKIQSDSGSQREDN